MQPQLIILSTPESIKELREYIKDFDILTLDSETTGVSIQDSIIGYSICAEESKAYYVILSAWNKETQTLDKLPGMFEASKPLIEDLKGHSLVAHNAVFDCMMFEAFFKISLIESIHTDTLVLAHLLDENRRIGLKELAADLFGDDSREQQRLMKESVLANGGQLTKANYEMYKADAQLMALYGAQDALLTLKIFYSLVADLYEQGLEEFFYNDESMPMLRTATYQLNTTGVCVDINKLTQLQKTLEAECAEAKAYILQEIEPKIKTKYPGTNKKNVFNIGSSSQLSWLIFGEIGLEFNTLTKAGKEVCKSLLGKLPYKPSDKKAFIYACIEAKDQVYGMSDKGKPQKVKDPWGYIQCDKSTLKKFADKYKWIAKLLEYQRDTKMLNTYVEGIQERTKYGIIHPSFKQAGTTSGRYSSSNPNWQNLPRKDKRIKQCVISRPGKIFVGADYSQLEPRVFAYMSQDKALMKAFEGDNDFYSVIGQRVYKKTDCVPMKEGRPDAFGVKYPELRDLSKVIALAATYGSTARLLSVTTKKSIEETQEDMDVYFSEFPDVAQMMLDSHAMAKAQGYVTNLFGRKRRIPEALKIDRIYGKKEHKDYPYEVRGLLNLAVNHRIQSTAASIVNRALIALVNNLEASGLKATIVNQVHDSIIVECSEADANNVALILQHSMENTTILPGISLEAKPLIGKSFGDV